MPANNSFGSVLLKGATVIADITSIGVSGIQRAEIDTTPLSSNSKTFLMGTVDSGTITVTFNYDDDHSVLVPSTAELVSVAWSIKYPCGGTSFQTLTFNAYQQSMSIESGVDQALVGNLTLRIDGAVTFSACVAKA